MAAGIASMQVSQSRNKNFRHSQASQISTTTAEKQLSVRKTGPENLNLKADKTLNVSSTNTKEFEERIGDKAEEASQETGAFINGMNKDFNNNRERSPTPFRTFCRRCQQSPHRPRLSSATTTIRRWKHAFQPTAKKTK